MSILIFSRLLFMEEGGERTGVLACGKGRELDGGTGLLLLKLRLFESVVAFGLAVVVDFILVGSTFCGCLGSGW